MLKIRSFSFVGSEVDEFGIMITVKQHVEDLKIKFIKAAKGLYNKVLDLKGKGSILIICLFNSIELLQGTLESSAGVGLQELQEQNVIRYMSAESSVR